MDGEISIIGNRVSELNNVGLKIQNDSYFIINRNNVSYKVKYSTLLKQLGDDIEKELGLSSMAFMDKDDYSKINHTHDYTNVNVIPIKTEGDTFLSVDFYQDNKKVKSVSIKQEYVKTPVLVQPYIGEIKFFANLKLPTTSTILETIQDGTFDGWVYPDGTTFSKTQGKYDFTEAYNLYNGSGNTFKIPKLTNFFKMCGNKLTDGLKFVDFNNVISAHSHSAGQLGGQTPYNEELDIELDILGGNSNIGSGSQYHLNFKTLDSYAKLWGEINKTNITGVTTIKTESEKTDLTLDIETKPRHYNIPAMIYIGVKKI